VIVATRSAGWLAAWLAAVVWYAIEIAGKTQLRPVSKTSQPASGTVNPLVLHCAWGMAASAVKLVLARHGSESAAPGLLAPGQVPGQLAEVSVVV
jgi:hypothetical protein